MDASSPEFQKDFAKNELDRIVAETFVEQVKYHTELDSTNSWALQFAREEPSRGVTLVLAERQTAGRGRGEKRWWSGGGALTFSVSFAGDALPLAQTDWPKVSLVAGLAVSEALVRFTNGHPPTLKWPNDVYLRGQKVCGILVEGSTGILVIGIGMNVNNSLAEAPDGLAASAISLRDVAGHEVSRDEILVAIIQRLEVRLKELRSGDTRWREDWQKTCLLTGRSVQLDTQGGTVAGICRGIDENGALLLETRTGVQRLLSGVVARFD